MERDKELAKLINVLRRTSRMALQSEWTGGKEDAAVFCTDQYNRVLARLKELDPGVSAVFEPLPAGSSLTVVAMAARQLAALRARRSSSLDSRVRASHRRSRSICAASRTPRFVMRLPAS